MNSKLKGVLLASILISACGGGSGDSAPVVTPEPEQNDTTNPFTPVENEPAQEPTETPEPVSEPEPTSEPVVEPETVEPEPTQEPTEAEIYDGTVYFEIDRVEVYDNSPTAVYLRMANYRDIVATRFTCTVLAYQHDALVMVVQNRTLYTPEGDLVTIEEGQDNTNRITLDQEGYTGHHVDKITYRCDFGAVGESFRTTFRGEWTGASIQGQFQ